MRSSAARLVPIPNTVPIEERLIVPLDVPSKHRAIQIVDALGDAVRFYKIGLQFIFAGGIDFVRVLRERNKMVFMDAKLNDIDQTVGSAIESIANLGVEFVTVHGVNGKSIREAVRARGNASIKIFSVTVLTSLDQADMHDLGIANKTLGAHALYRAESAAEAGADGVIASALETAEIKRRFPNLLVITPGIRSGGVSRDDQKRVASPGEAIKAGADYLVVGRQITGSANPRDAARRVLDEMREAIPPPSLVV